MCNIPLQPLQAEGGAMEAGAGSFPDQATGTAPPPSPPEPPASPPAGGETTPPPPPPAGTV